MKHEKPDPTRPIIISPGPTSPAGKQISSRNATKHGCCSTETLILRSESEEELKSLQNAWFRAYEPKDQAEVHLVRQLVHADWFFQRATRTLAQVEAQLFETMPDPMHWDESAHRTLSRFFRYQTTRNNVVAKRTKALEDYRKNRAADLTRTQNGQHKDERLIIAKARLELYRERNKAVPSWDEEFEQMTQKAIHLGYHDLAEPDTA